jgi:methionyl-tRNA formyltransferase
MTSIAFLGSHPLGEACLRRLHDHPDAEVPIVITYPRDEKHWWDGSVHDLALELGYEVLTLSEEEDLLEYEFDWLLSVYYPNILEKALLDHPQEGALNLHQAELPRYRGSNVFSHSIMNARDDDYWQHGTTLHFMAPRVDAGDVVARRFAEITEEDTARSLYERVREESVALFEEELPNIVDSSVAEDRTPQESFDGERYYYAKDSLDDLKEIPIEALSNPDREKELYDRIRALDFPPHEPAWTRLNGKKVYLTKDGYNRFE